MTKRNTAKPTQTRAKQKTAEPRRWPTFMLILVCGLMLVAGFFFAGRQHFSSMDYGMKNSRLRKQVDDLEAEKRRLLLAREVALSPAEIKKAARKAGFTDAPETAAEVAKLTISPTSPTAAPAKDKAIPTSVAAVSQKPLIVRTASVTPAPAAVTATYSKSDARAERIVKPAKKTIAVE